MSTFFTDNLELFSKAVSVIVVFTCLPVHEFAHAFVADKLGDTTPRWEGRLTLNPFAHLDLWGSLALVLFGFGWAKPVPVNSRAFKNPKVGMALTSAAGPLANVLIALVVMIVLKALVLMAGLIQPTEFFSVFILILYFMIQINVYLAVFNLLPIPPLDGSRLFFVFLPQKAYFQLLRYERIIMVVVFVLLYFRLLDIPLHWLAAQAIGILDWGTLLLGPLGLPY